MVPCRTAVCKASFLHTVTKGAAQRLARLLVKKVQKSKKMRRKVRDVYLITKKRECFLCKTTAVFFKNGLAELEKSCIMVDILLLQ